MNIRKARVDVRVDGRVDGRVEAREEFMPMARIFSEVDTLMVTSGKRTLTLTIDDLSHFHTIAVSEHGVI